MVSKQLPNDAPELPHEFFTRADDFPGATLVSRGRPPIGEPHKVATTLRLSPEVMAAFRVTGKGRQARIDAALKDWLTTHTPG